MDDDASLAETVATYDRHAEQYSDRHADRSVIAEQVERFCAAVESASSGPDGEGRRVLDVGCGPGWETETFARQGFDAVGVDLSQAFLVRARDRAAGRFLCGDMRELPVASDAVDGVWAMASLLHLPRSAAADALAEFARVARPEATLFLAVKRGTGTTEGDGYDGDRRTFTLYREGPLCERVEHAGFAVVDSGVETGGDGWVRVLARRP
jgi:SAM-dependent methyltransferase